MSKYTQLTDYLQKIKRRQWSASFSDIEKIIGNKLPKSAYEHRAWWANNPTGHSHSRAWIEAGWETENVNMACRHLIFVKKAGFDNLNNNGANIADPWGSMEASVTIFHDEDLTMPVGEIWNSAQIQGPGSE